ncbi:ATP-binding cassette subfamily C protein LapB [Novosphingobium sp. PhB165]|uniref:type I secretion system permease/ATPase n=1 Tax=Novosphingobium sp. PhB165 TaxID=2485105 RepID=UPI001052E172|nr:type I secretion system permease/ATPase [Novosphingobium sp. PhB165]TCM17069.1 ATP-binding cassette subfamily C protein LapB [Novosphingobium sp. PhB165]
MADGPAIANKSWIAAIAALGRLKGVPVGEPELVSRLYWSDGQGSEATLAHAARLSGLHFEILRTGIDDVPPMLLPAIFELQDNGAAIVHSRHADHVQATLPSSGGNAPVELTLDSLRAQATGRVGFVEPLSARSRDARLDEFLRRPAGSWLRDIIMADRRGYGEVMMASFSGNLLTFATSLFAMQVWDRVIPAQSIPTLWVLALGTAMALLLELTLRSARVQLVDRIGRRADLAISSRVFARALDIRNDARPRSTGALIAQLRDIEQLREMLTSTTISALIDLPFIVMFLILFALLAGPLTFVLVGAALLIVLPGLLLQRPLARLAREGMREAALRNAILVESIERIDEIKSAQAEPRFQSLWERLTLTGTRVGAEQRFLSALFVNWTQTLQQLAYTVVIVAGSFRVMDGRMTMGALIACSILTSRALVLFVPFGQVFARWQHAKIALAGLEELFARPVDHDPERGLLRRPSLRGHYELKDLTYAYDPEAPVALKIERLSIAAGERVALLGRIGAGKSTLLRLLAGLALPTSGEALLDGTGMAQISPADIRRDTAYLGQNAQLFLGTIRENLVIGAPGVTDEEILRTLAVTGGIGLVQNQPQGLDLLLQEGGAGLSGGQRQTLLLTRVLLRRSNVLLLDEPSAALDEISERNLVANLGQWLRGRTLIVTTNRPGLLDLVDRVVLMDNGRVTLDGPKAMVLPVLAGRSADQEKRA